MPWSASSSRPILCEIAPVNAPRSCPNSSLSSKPVGDRSAIQFDEGSVLATAAIVNSARDQFLTRTVSPRSNTVESLGATVSTRLKTWRRAEL